MVRTRQRCGQRSGAERPRRRPRPCGGVAPGAVEALLGEPVRLYVATLDDGVIDVLDDGGEHLARWDVGGDPLAIAAVLLHDATGRPPRAATVGAFAEDVLARTAPEGFALSSSEVCAWLLIRAIERTNT